MNILDKVTGCYYGVAIGDALGSAVEMMKPEDILSKNDGKPIDGFDHKIRRKQFRSELVPLPIVEKAAQEIEKTLGTRQRWSSTSLKNKLFEQFLKLGLVKNDIKNAPTYFGPPPKLPEIVHGSTTDDFQLTLAVHKSLVRRSRFDVTDVALAHVESYETSTSGWGGTTRNSLKELQEYFNSKGARGRSPNEAPAVVQGRGSGNGVAMKVTPIALAHLMLMPFPQPDELLAAQVADLGRLTHSDARAWAAAYALACVLIESNHVFDKTLTQDGTPPSTKILERVIQHLAPFERRHGSGKLKRFSSYLKILLDEKLLFGPIEALREEVGTDCIAIESVVFAIALFLRNPRDFRTGVLEAVNSGGDADTIASMVGGLIGFLVGPDEIPVEWINHNPEFAKADQAARELYTVFSTDSL